MSGGPRMATEKIVVVESARSARGKIVVVAAGFGIVRLRIRKSSSSSDLDESSRMRLAQRRA
jgi:hypothetical protein